MRRVQVSEGSNARRGRVLERDAHGSAGRDEEGDQEHLAMIWKQRQCLKGQEIFGAQEAELAILRVDGNRWSIAPRVAVWSS